MKSIKKILCAVDFSDLSENVTTYAKYFAQQCDAEVLLLYVAQSIRRYGVFELNPDELDAFVDDVAKGARASMDQTLRELFADVSAEGRVETGYISEAILNAAEQEQVDLIIIGTHGRQGMERVYFGSVAEKVLKGAKIPVLTVRPTHMT